MRAHSRIFRLLAVCLLVVTTGCAGGSSATPTTAPTPGTTLTDVSSPSVIASPTLEPTACDEAGATSLDDVSGDFAMLMADTDYWVDPDYDRSTPLCAIFTVPADGWRSFLGTYKDVEEDGDLVERVNATITDVTNLTVDACNTHVPLVPPVGPSVEDLATALAQFPPFEVALPATDVTIYGYSGKHIKLRVPDDLAYIRGRFTGCKDGILRTWIAPVLSFAFYGYTAPGDTEDFWILDVEGKRLVILALTSAKASEALIAERQSVLDSIVIKP